jgi:hypothetical protein
MNPYTDLITSQVIQQQRRFLFQQAEYIAVEVGHPAAP